MNYNSFFETSLYRECNKSRTETNIEIAGKNIRIAIFLSYLLGTADTILVRWIGSLENDTALKFLLIVCVGLITGGLLGRLWIVTIRTIRTAYRNYMYEIEMLTQKMDAMQNNEESEEDYELVGDRDD